MGKIYTFLTLILPILGFLVFLQIAMLTFRREFRVRVNFAVISILAISSIRPNILGESFGLISPLYFLALVYLSRSLPPEYVPSNRVISKARNGLMLMFVILAINWLFKAFVSSGNGYSYNYWPPIANIFTIGFSCFSLLQIFKTGSLLRFFRYFLYLLVFQAIAGLISRYILNFQYCINFNAGRGWDYSLCAPGAVFSNQVRLTGISGEPSIFAVYLAIAAIAIWWPQLNMGAFRRIFFSGVCILTSIVSGATTGAIVGLLALSLIFFQRSSLKNGPIIMIFSSIFSYVLVQGRFVQNYVEGVFSNKKKENLSSISDRNLNLDFSDYLTRWGSKPFGNDWGIGGVAYSSGINLLAESLLYGPITILLMFCLVVAAVAFSLNKIRTSSIGILVFLVCLTLQPAWANAIWFLWLYLSLLVNLITDSSLKKQKELMNEKF